MISTPNKRILETLLHLVLRLVLCIIKHLRLQVQLQEIQSLQLQLQLQPHHLPSSSATTTLNQPLPPLPYSRNLLVIDIINNNNILIHPIPILIPIPNQVYSPTPTKRFENSIHHNQQWLSPEWKITISGMQMECKWIRL